jgi:hypothetical protein
MDRFCKHFIGSADSALKWEAGEFIGNNQIAYRIKFKLVYSSSWWSISLLGGKTINLNTQLWVTIDSDSVF